MDYEKAYKDAVSKIKSIIADKKKQGLTNCLLEGDLNEIFPELKKSEDERIREWIITFIEVRLNGAGEFIDDYKNALAWLKKQGKRKSADKVEPKFKVGDRVNKNDREDEEYNILTITSVNINEHCYICNQCSVIDFEEQDLWHIVERNPMWSEEDEKMMQCIHKYVKASASNFDYGNIKMWFESLKNRVQPHWKPTKEQMTAFEHFVKSIGESGYASPYDNNTKLIYSLLNDLKKL